MDTQTHEIAEGIYRFSTFVPGIGPAGLTFNQYLIDDEQPPTIPAGVPVGDRRCRFCSHGCNPPRLVTTTSATAMSKPTSAGP